MSRPVTADTAGDTRCYAIVRNSGGAKICRLRKGSGPSVSHDRRNLGMVAAAPTRYTGLGAGPTDWVQAGGL